MNRAIAEDGDECANQCLKYRKPTTQYLSNRSTGQLTHQYLSTFGMQLRVDAMRVDLMKS